MVQSTYPRHLKRAKEPRSEANLSDGGGGGGGGSEGISYFIFPSEPLLHRVSCAPLPTPSMLKVSRPAEALNFNAVSSSQPSSFGLPIAYPERIVRLRGKSNVTVGWPNPYLPEFQNIRSMDQQNHQKPGLATIQQSSQRAPSYHVPQFSVVSVEHPFIIRNVGKAIEMLGGLPRVNSVRDRAISIH